MILKFKGGTDKDGAIFEGGERGLLPGICTLFLEDSDSDCLPIKPKFAKKSDLARLKQEMKQQIQNELKSTKKEISRSLAQIEHNQQENLVKIKQISSDLAEMKKNIQKEKNLDKLDNLLLFASSLMGYIFVLIQFIFGKTAIVLLFTPLLIFGVVIPFYYGYIKGSLQQSPINRVRGWVYFSFGLGIYIWFTSSVGILILLSKLNQTGNKFLMLGILAAIFAGCSRFANFISKKYEYRFNKEDIKKLLSFIMSAAAWCALSLIGYFGYLVYELNPFYAGILISICIFGCVITFLNLIK